MYLKFENYHLQNSKNENEDEIKRNTARLEQCVKELRELEEEVRVKEKKFSIKKKDWRRWSFVCGNSDTELQNWISDSAKKKEGKFDFKS